MHMQGLTCLFLVMLHHSASSSESCPEASFKDSLMSQCQPCTVCEVNTVIREPCTSVSDTVCGPFLEFSFFNHEKFGDGTEAFHRWLDRRTHEQGMEQGYRNPADSATVPSNDESGSLNNNGSGKSGAVETPTDRWKELCFGLIGALAAVTTLALLYVFITLVRHRNGTFKNPQLADGETAVVYYHSQYPGGVPVGHPHLEAQLQENVEKRTLQRLFQPGASGNEYVDELCESRLSATPFLLHPIPESEIPNFQLAPIHKAAKKNAERIRMARTVNADLKSPAHNVTEMLLSHHKCQCES